MHAKKYYIEFVGQHTAGKTSTIHEIIDKGLLAPLVAVYPQKIRRSRLHFGLMLPVFVIRNFWHLLFVAYLLCCYAKLNWINYHAAGRHLLKMVILHPYYKRFDFDIWMKDDMLHLLPRIAFRDGVDVEAVFRKFFMHFEYLYDGIVYFELPYEIMRQRFQSRFSTRTDRRRRSREPVYERAFTQNEVLEAVLIEQSQIPVLVLRGTDEVSKNARRVVEFIHTQIYEK